MTRETQETAAKPARTIKDEWENSLKGYGLTAWLAAVTEAENGEELRRVHIRPDQDGGGNDGMTDRYGNTRVAKIRAAYNDLRAAIRAGDIEAAERALDRYEPWADYVFGAPKVKPLDFSRALKHAFLSGFVAAKNLPAHEPYNGNVEWVEYDASGNLAAQRILSALAQEGE